MVERNNFLTRLISDFMLVLEKMKLGETSHFTAIFVNIKRVTQDGQLIEHNDEFIFL